MSEAVIHANLPFPTPCFSGPIIDNLDWNEVSPNDVEGRGWRDTAAPFDRLPPEAEKIAQDLWGASRSTTGECFEFETDSTAIAVRTKLGLAQYGEPNFNSSAFAGCDLYCWDETQNRWRWAATAQHMVEWKPITEYGLCWSLKKTARRFRMYLPMRNQLLALWVGVDEGSSFRLIPPRREKPLVYYGTSIIHGAFSIRAGLGVPQILGRELGVPVINLGFSGAARLEPAMADILAQLDAGVFVCDPYHNSTIDSFKANAEPFFGKLCAARPETPVYLLSAPPVLNAWMWPDIVLAEHKIRSRLFADTGAMLEKRHPNFRFIDGENFYGSDDTSIDGIHPNDVAFDQMAKILAPILRKHF